MSTFRFNLAKRACRSAPPFLAQQLRNLIYPHTVARQDDFDFITSSQTGSVFKSRVSEYHAYHFAVHGYFDWRNWAIAMCFAGPGSIIVEIGANIGTETIGFADIVYPGGRVFCFEPLPDNRVHLESVLKLNQTDHVTVFGEAVSDRLGNVRFAVPERREASGVGHILSSAVPESRSQHVLEVPTTSLDEFKESMDDPAILFIDAEGAEPLILHGGQHYLTRYRPPIVLESSPKLLARSHSSPRALAEQLRVLGYNAFEIARFGLRAINDETFRKQKNWLCLPRNRADRRQLHAVTTMIRKCGAMPLLFNLNPLRSPRRRTSTHPAASLLSGSRPSLM